MAVLAEALSVIINDKDLSGADFKDWDDFLSIVPAKQTVASDSELIRVGFMHPDDADAFIETLESKNLVHLQNGKAKDMVIVNQIYGFASECDWATFGQIEIEKGKVVSACAHINTEVDKLYTPLGWTYESSLFNEFNYVPMHQVKDSMVFLRTKGNLDVYLDYDTGKEVYVGRSGNRR